MSLKAIFIGVKLDTISSEDFRDELDELTMLASACDIEKIEEVTQNLPFFNKQTYFGKGKVDELKTIIESLEAEVVICNDELTALQIASLNEVLDIDIYDRTYLILEIFRSRAKTKEAIIQVEIASLKYMLPRLVGMRKGLSRQRGAGGGYAHGRGAGETKLELDKRYTKERLSALNSELKELQSTRKQQRIRRNKSDIKTVCLVGYTNSGKSSTLNAILKKSSFVVEDKEVMEKDMLFATLETSTRRVETSKGNFLITDTVGFIEKLPHHLVEAFKSTLEEINEADLIVHVVDGSNPKHDKQIEVTQNVLMELGVPSIPIIYAFNKIDKIKDYLYIPNIYKDALRISAINDINISNLIDMIIDKLYVGYHEVSFFIPYEKQSIMYKISEQAIDFKVEYKDNGIIVSCKTSEYISNLYDEYKL